MLNCFKMLSIPVLLLLSCCSKVQDHSLPKNTEFTHWILTQIDRDETARENNTVRQIIKEWEKLYSAAENNAPMLRNKRKKKEFEKAKEEWETIRRKTSKLLEKAFLVASPAVERLCFTIGGGGQTARSRKGSWTLETGETKHVLIHIHNKTEETLSVKVTGGSGNGFYVWPWQQQLKPGSSFFSLLKIIASSPGERKNSIFLNVTSPSGKKEFSEITLTGRFSAPETNGGPERKKTQQHPVSGPHQDSKWYAGSIYPFQEPEEGLEKTMQQMRKRGILLCHVGPGPGASGFGFYPVTLSETFQFRGTSGIIVKGSALSHPYWGGIAVLNARFLDAGTLNSPALPGRTDWPDLLSQCKHIHSTGGTVIGIPSGEGESNETNLQLPLAALLGELDALYLTEELLPLWYDLLNCGIRLPPAGAGQTGQTDTKTETAAYVHLSENFTYERYLHNLCSGKVFVSSSALLELKVSGRPPSSALVDPTFPGCLPGDTYHCRKNTPLRIKASAHSKKGHTPLEVEVIANGKCIKRGKGLDFTWTPDESTWIAARTASAYTNHTGAVYILVEGKKIFDKSAADSLLENELKNLENFINEKAFLLPSEKKQLINALKRGEKNLQKPVPYQRERRLMVTTQLQNRDIHDKQVLEVMRRVPRHLFVPLSQEEKSYIDRPLPIGYGQTISQPYIVAYMTQALELKGDEKVLEIGTGSGYQAAILSELADEVYTIEIIEPLARKAGKLFRENNYKNVHVRFGNGYKGWPEEAPFDAIIVTAAPPEVPEALIKQLARGGRMIVPVGTYSQELRLITKNSRGAISQKNLLPVIFVPMTDRLRRE